MGEARKEPKLSDDQLLQKLLDSLISKEEIETKNLEELIKNTSNFNDAIGLVKKLDKLTKSSKNNILVWAYQQGKVFQEFNSSNNFANAVTEFGINKTTINFKIDIVKFIESYPNIEEVLYLAFLS